MLHVFNQVCLGVPKKKKNIPEAEVQVYWRRRTFLLHCGLLVWNWVTQAAHARVMLQTVTSNRLWITHGILT